MGKERVQQRKLEHSLRQQELWRQAADRQVALRAQARADHDAEWAARHEPAPLEPIETFPPVPVGLEAVDILSFNDLHRALFPVANGTGGAARLAGTLKSLMREYPHAIIVNGGDVTYDAVHITGPSSFQPIPELFRAMHVSILELGNHEFQDPTDDYAALRQGLLQPFSGDVLCANVVDPRQPFNTVKPYTIQQLAGYNVAFIGVVTQDMATSAHPAVAKGLRVEDIGKTLKHLVPEVKSQGADTVVVLAHEGLPIMTDVASHQDGIDHILAAHDHLKTRTPRVVITPSGAQTTMTEAGSYGHYVNHTRLLMDPKTRHCVGVQSQLIPIDSRSPVDPEVEALVARYQA